jgi:hypothetical protein
MRRRRAISALLTFCAGSSRTSSTLSAADLGRPADGPRGGPDRARHGHARRGCPAQTPKEQAGAMARPVGMVRSSASVSETNPTPRARVLLPIDNIFYQQ